LYIQEGLGSLFYAQQCLKIEPVRCSQLKYGVDLDPIP
jgi:hypothetical protein